MPQNPSIIATKAPRNDVCIFDYTRHPTEPPVDGVSRPDLRLKGHNGREGYVLPFSPIFLLPVNLLQLFSTETDPIFSSSWGLAWNPSRKGILADCSDDKTVCIWDIEGAKSTEVQPLVTLHGHEDTVEDVSWNNHHEHFCISVGDDGKMIMWDKRTGKAQQTAQGSTKEVNCVSFNPFSEWIFATGAGDNTAAIWDVRNFSTKLHSFYGHHDAVFTLQWSPFNETIFATGSHDRRVHVWDVSRIGQPQTKMQAEDGPPELLFIHGGHTAKVSDLAWSPNEDWVIASVGEDNILQVWQMAENIYTFQDSPDTA